MKDYLLDIVQHTYSLGFVELLKVTGSSTKTRIDAVATDQSVVVMGEFNGPIAEFIGTFGMPSLAKLNTILGIPEYKENAKLKVQTREGSKEPVGLLFTNTAGDFENTYRFMGANIINEKLKEFEFREPKWDVVVSPSVLAIQKLKFQAQANSEETVFKTKTKDGKLMVYFGDHSSHAGNFVFEQGVTGKIEREWSWPVAAVNSILSLPGTKVVHISDQGAMMITVDSGIATYKYFIGGRKK